MLYALRLEPYAFSYFPHSNFRIPDTFYRLFPAPMPITCHKCIHYYVTWDQQFPHGCRVMGFKSKQMPVTEVRRAVRGKDCLLFKIKQLKIQSENSNYSAEPSI